MNKIVKKLSILMPSIFLVACSKLPSYFAPSNINDKVYITPHKPLEIPKLKGVVNFPEPNDSSGIAKHYVVESDVNSEDLTLPPAQYAEPAVTAPIGVLGEDEEMKELRRKPNENVTPSKKSIWGGN